MRILVTTAGGDRGPDIANHLTDGHEVTLLDTGGDTATPAEIAVKRADLCDDGLEELLVGVDAIVHAASFETGKDEGTEAARREIGRAHV